MATEKERRPWQDESLTLPFYRQLYSAFYLGRLPPDPRAEEPLKFTHALMHQQFVESCTEWIARLNENTVAAQKWIAGEMEDEMVIMNMYDMAMRGDWAGLIKMPWVEDAVMKLTGESSIEDALYKYVGERTVEGAMEKFTGERTIEGAMDAVMSMSSEDMMSLVEVASGMISEISSEIKISDALEIVEGFISEDMFTSFGFHPPILDLPIRISPIVIAMLIGTTVDNFYYEVDHTTMEGLPFLENYHYEDGVQMARQSFWYENAEAILDRRHMRTGEKFRNLAIHRAPGEAGKMAGDMLSDIRNEKTPEYSNSLMIAFPYNTIVTPDCQSTVRSFYDFVPVLLWMIYCRRYGWPIDAYVSWIPRPPILSMLGELPLDQLFSRFIPMVTGMGITGLSIWIPKYNLTHLETTMETIGQEAIIPSPWFESPSAYIRYGMDLIRYPSSFIQSIRVYGQESQIRWPTEYPCPEKMIKSLDWADEQIKKARSEHPEWLTDSRGFAH
jgi:hypothetical protein